MKSKKLISVIASAVMLSTVAVALPDSSSKNNVEAANYLKRQHIPAKYQGTWYSGSHKVRISANKLRGRSLGSFNTIAYHSNAVTAEKMHYNTHKLLWWHSGRGIEFSLPGSQPARMTVSHKNGCRVLNLYIGIGKPFHYYRR